ESGEVGGGGTGERVDGLVWVADHAHVVTAGRPGVEQQLLKRVDVLELIDHEVAVPVGDLGSGERVLGEDGGGEFQHGLEVHQVPLPAQLLVRVIHAGGGLRVQRGVTPGGKGSRRVAR